LFGREFLRRAERAASCNIGEHVNPTEMLQRLFDRLSALACVGHIERHCQCTFAIFSGDRL